MRTEADPTIAARIPKDHYDMIGRIAAEWSERDGKKVRRSDVIRHAVAELLKGARSL